MHRRAGRASVRWTRIALSLLSAALFACTDDDPSAASALPWESWRAVGMIGDTVPVPNARIGTIRETAITSRGQILVLDGEHQRVIAVDETGRVLAGGSSTAELPGPLSDPAIIAALALDPVAIDVLQGDDVVLVDRNRRRIDVLLPVELGLQGARSAMVGFRPEAACVLRGELFLLGNMGDEYLHRFAMSLDAFSSLSPVPPDPDIESADTAAAARRRALGQGALACDEESGILMHAPAAHGVVYGIRPDGRFAWTLALDSVDSGGEESVVRVTPLGDGQAQVLIRRSRVDAAARPPAYRAILIDVTNGAVLRQVASPRHWGVVTARWATEHLGEPATAVRIWRR